MNSNPNSDAVQEFERAREYLARDNIPAAMGHLEKALKICDDPHWSSFLGYCIARERGQFRKGIELCEKSIEADRENPRHYHNLGRVFLLYGRKADAIKAFRDGLAYGDDQELHQALLEIGARKAPVLRFLPRENPLNKFLGILFKKVRLR